MGVPPPPRGFFFPLEIKFIFSRKALDLACFRQRRSCFLTRNFPIYSQFLGEKQASTFVCMAVPGLLSRRFVCTVICCGWTVSFLSNTGRPLQFACWTLLRYGPRSFLRFVRLIAWERYVAIGKRIDYKVVLTKSLIKTCQ